MYYEDVEGFGRVVVSRHAQARLEESRIPVASFEAALFNPTLPDFHQDSKIAWRERNGLRLIILKDIDEVRGANLIKTVYRVNGLHPVVRRVRSSRRW